VRVALLYGLLVKSRTRKGHPSRFTIGAEALGRPRPNGLPSVRRSTINRQRSMAPVCTTHARFVPAGGSAASQASQVDPMDPRALSESFDRRGAELLGALRTTVAESPLAAGPACTPAAERVRAVSQAPSTAIPVCAPAAECPSADALEERVVTLEESRKKPVARLFSDVPRSVRDVGSEESLRKYTLESLRKLAKAEGLEMGKTASRERVVQELAALLIAPRTGDDEVCAQAAP